MGKSNGVYLVREGEDGYRLSVLHYDDTRKFAVAHYRILYDRSNETYHLELSPDKFISVCSLLSFYSRQGSNLVCALRIPCPRPVVLPGDLNRIRKDDVMLTSLIASGELGKLWKATLYGADVAIKEKRVSSVHFQEEATALHLLRHKDIIPVLGVVDARPPQLILKFCSNRDLLSYLLNTGSYEVPFFARMRMTSQVVSALQHVSVMRYIHRNVKASNVLVDSCLNCKLSGFGHARKMDETGKYREQEDDLSFRPTSVRWMALECLTTQTFSTASDVWSLACFMVEVFTNGEPPFAGLIVSEISRKVQSGFRPRKPEYIPDALYALMLRCWYPDCCLRPTLRGVQSVLDEFVAQEAAPRHQTTLTPLRGKR